jgi:hypothetical protein
LVGALGIVLALGAAGPLRAQSSLVLPTANAASQQLKASELAGALRAKIPNASQDEIDRISAQFMDHMQQTSSIAADELAAGKLDSDDLSSRLDVFLEEHPELTGQAAPHPVEDPRTRVADALKAFPDVARSDAERTALADRFIERLAIDSGMARQSLLAGRMSDDELQSRISVFAADVRAERSRAAVDPAVAAADPIIESFEKASFGNATDRPDAICYKGQIDGGGRKRDFVIFEKRPNKLRIHILENGIVIGVLAYDGKTAWTQSPGRPARTATPAQARSIIGSSRFDDAFSGYQDRGAVARLDAKPDKGPLRLSLREKDGTELDAEIDPSSFEEISRRTRLPDGSVEEVRLKDYRRIGPLNFAFTQEHWMGGVLHSTTRVTEVELNPGLLDRFFAIPSSFNLGFMDYMGGLLILQSSAKAGPQAASGAKGGS